MSKYIFIPILKSKSSAEPKVASKCKSLFSNSVIPLIEIIDGIEGRGYKKISSELSDILHFEQYYRKNDNILDIITLTSQLSSELVIPCLRIMSSSEIDFYFNEIKKMIISFHLKKSSCALRIPAGIFSDNLNYILSSFSKQDYLFIDIGVGEYKAVSDYVDYIKSNSHNCNIIILSNERPTTLTGTLMAYNDYNKSFNTSVINSIKNNDFLADGFASFCSAKDDLNQSARIATKVYATFLIYNYSRNEFYSFKTKDIDHVSKIYKKLKLDIPQKIDFINAMFFLTPISAGMLKEFLNSEKKGNASTYISISIVHYIEEIVNNINS